MQPIVTRRNLAIGLVALVGIFFGIRSFAPDPEKVGHQVFEVYVDAMAEANTLLEGTPLASEVESDLAGVKERAIEKLVVLGHGIAEMSEGNRAIVEATVRQSLSTMRQDPETKGIYDAYQAVWKAYHQGDAALFYDIKSLNILTQYAFFDLLRAEEPAEADRLGV